MKDLWCTLIHDSNELVLNRMFPSDRTPGRDDIQFQSNLWRRVMAMEVNQNTWRLEFNEATDAWRSFFFQVQFQVSKTKK